MTYPNADQPSRFAGGGFRVEPEFRQASGTPEGLAEGEFTPTVAQPSAPGPTALTAAELSGVFDDPSHGDPGRDRFAVHVIWELILLIAAAGLAFVLVHGDSHALSGANLQTLLTTAAITGTLGLAAGLSLRVGAVNLAIGPIMVIAGLYYAQHRAADGIYRSGGIALALALGCGAVIALVVTLLHVPAWAASLAAILGAQIWLAHFPSAVGTYQDLSGGSVPSHRGFYWFAILAVVAVVGAAIGAVRSVRRAIGRYRPVSDPAQRRGSTAAVIAAFAVAVSGLLAGVAGIGQAVSDSAAVNSNGLLITGIGLGVALLGGTSAFGRRGGVFGTVLAACVAALAGDWVARHAWRGGEEIVIAVAITVGLLVTRMVESYGRPRSVPSEPPTAVLPPAPAGSWALSDRPATEDGTWVDASDERWGAR